jgi:hypothetical protein
VALEALGEQVLDYTRRDPLRGKWSDTFSWVRSACPCDRAQGRDEWRRSEPTRFTNDELLEDFGKVERLVAGPPIELAFHHR